MGEETDGGLINNSGIHWYGIIFQYKKFW